MVNLGAEVAAALPEFRSQADSTLFGECVITRAGVGAPVLNEETGMYEDPAPVTVYSGPCDLKFKSSVTRQIDAQGQAGVEQEPYLKLPVVGSEGVRLNDVATITAHQFDAAFVGLEARIAGVHGGTVSARRFPVEVTSWGS